MYPFIQIIIPTYSALAALAMLVVLIFLYVRIEKYQLKFSDFIKMFLFCLLFGFIGSRLVFFISMLPVLVNHFSIENVIHVITHGGFVFYGGLLGVLWGTYRYSKKHNLELKRVNNMMTPAIPLFHAIGRVGCFMAGCCYGVALSQPVTVFGLTFTRFPTQLVEAVFEFILFIVVYLYQKKKPESDSLRIYMITYAIFRFVIEFVRGDTIRGLFFGVSTSQIISIGIIVFYIISAIRKKKSSNKSADEN